MKTATWTPFSVDIEYCARFPWRGGKHPWLDAFVESSTDIVGIESKRFEPFRDKKQSKFSVAYERDVWHDRMEPFKKCKNRLKSGELRFEFLDATQLIKHAFGMITEGRRKQKVPHLVYLFAEPVKFSANWAAHRAEIVTFADAVKDSEVGFEALSYRDWLATWAAEAGLNEHRANILQRFEP